jgi:hypothetical protein
MILRRLTNAFRKQDWLIVAVEILIVVIGVFVGLQAHNWNDARRNRETEALYLTRLQQELSEMSSQADTEVAEVREVYDLITEVTDYFETGQGIDKLNGTHCGAIVRSHIFAGAIFYPPTIKELIATGRIVLVRDNALRTAILSFDGANTEITQLRTDIQIDRLLLARKYPDLIRHGLNEWEDATCDFAAMAESQSFLNDFIDNYRRYSAYVSDVQERQSKLIDSLGEIVALNRGTSFTPAVIATSDERVAEKDQTRPATSPVPH